MGIKTALCAFWGALTDCAVSERISAALRDDSAAEISTIDRKKTKSANQYIDSEEVGDLDKVNYSESSRKGGVGRSSETGTAASATSALTLLAALQREARFVDFVKEPLDGCDEAAIGAAARGVHDRCAIVLERFFEIRPLSGAEEGATTTLDAATARNSARVRLLGRDAISEKDAQDAPIVGRLAHAGWIARKSSAPIWAGAPEDAAVLAPIELEVGDDKLNREN